MTPTTCEHAETFWTLVTDVAHWELELFIMLIFDGLIGVVAWPFAKRWWGRHHRHDVCDPPKYSEYRDTDYTDTSYYDHAPESPAVEVLHKRPHQR